MHDSDDTTERHNPNRALYALPSPHRFMAHRMGARARALAVGAAAAAAAAGVASAQQPGGGDVWRYNTAWDAPSPGPGRTVDGYATYQDAMPLGNGALTAVAWANATAGGVGLYLGHQMAQSSWSELFKLGMLQVALSPNPYVAGGYFNQTLDLSTGSVVVLLGGASAADYAVSLRVWADANADALYVDVASRDPAVAFSLTAVATSTRPAGTWTYMPQFGLCDAISTQPDVYLPSVPGPVGAPFPVDAAGEGPGAGVRRPTAARLPSRTLAAAGRLPRVAAFQPGTLIAYHRNADADGLFVNYTLTQQGVPQLVATTPDWWRDLTSGFALDGGAGPALARVDAHTLASTAPAAAFQLRATVLAVQASSPQQWATELALRVAAAEPDPWPAHAAWWDAFWGRSWVHVNGSASDAAGRGGGGGGDAGFALSRKYATTRYVHAAQSRGTPWPIKFNGMAFMAAMGTSGEPEFRKWSMGNTWQNTRLPYGAMAAAGDFEQWRVVLDYYTNMGALLVPRTQAYWGHAGMWTPEMHALFGGYMPSDYGCARPPGYPTPLMTDGYMRLDGGGDSGTGEWAIMALDFFWWTGDAAYLPLAFAAAEFLTLHYPNRSATTGRQVVWPAQVLETYWCTYNVTTRGYENCCEDDAPTISAMMALAERLLALPAAVTTPAQRAQWAAWRAILPTLPVAADNSTVLPARVVSSGTHNDEGPELYPIHPHRVWTKGRAVARGEDISLGERTVAASRFARENAGWNYGLCAAALIGDTELAAPQVLARALTGAPAGYRFDGFADHFQDYEPSADYYANMARATQEMLLQSGDDYESGSPSLVLFPAWPCSWDVDARLVGPLNTTVTLSYAGGKLVSLDVQPPSRAAAVKWANCVAGA